MDLYRKHETLGVTEVARKIGLSRTTVMKIHDSLLEEGIILEAGKGGSTDEGGKKPLLYRLNPGRNYILTYHIQYERIRFRCFNIALKTRYSEVLPIERDLPLEQVLARLRSLYERAREEIPGLEEKVLALMLAIHGTVDSEEGVARHAAYFPSWGLNAPIAEECRRLWGGEIPVYVDNWIRFKAFAETRAAGLGTDKSIVLIDGGWHGLSAGIVLEGRPYKGRNFLSGEMGHMILDPEDDRLCACGARGCLESLILCDRLVEEARALAPEFPASPLGDAASMEDRPLFRAIFEAAARGDELGRLLAEKRIRYFARGLANLCVTIDPDVLIIEGDYAAQGGYFQNRLREEFQRMTFPRMRKEGEILFRETPSETPKTLEGAAAYAFNRYFLRV